MQPAVIRDRKDFVDIAKGLTILLVVIEHNVFIYKYHITTQAIILSFHMPLFYFVSGLFFSSSESLTVLTKKRFNSLLKPYFVSCFLFFFLKSIKDFQLGNIWYFISGVLYGTGESLSWPYEQLWFLTSLFVTILACSFLYSVLKRVNSVWERSIFLCILLVGGILCIKQISTFPNGGLPWNIDLLGITVFFYALGFETRKWIFRVKGVPVQHFFIALLVFIALHYFFTISLNDPHTLHLNLRKYDHLFVNSIEAVSGIFVIIFLSVAIDIHIQFISHIFSYIGQRSLTVFVFHLLLMPYIGNAGKAFLAEDSLFLFALTILLTVGITLIVHEFVSRIPVARFLMLNERARQVSYE